jgi:hypothetical protein
MIGFMEFSSTIMIISFTAKADEVAFELPNRLTIWRQV